MNLIYALINNVNHKLYVGSTTNPYNRFRGHTSSLRCNRHRNPYLQNAHNKYGKGCFTPVVLEFVDGVNNLMTREIFWINYFESCNKDFGYNIEMPNESGCGFTSAPETREKISEIKTGGKHSKETRDKMVEAWKKRKERDGPHLSKETIEKMSASTLESHKNGVYSYTYRFTDEYKQKQKNRKRDDKGRYVKCT